MEERYVDLKSLQFVLYDVLNAEQLTQYEHYKDHDRSSFDMVIEAAKQIADRLLYPNYREMDKQESDFVDGKVKVHPVILEYVKAMGEAGMIGATFSYEDGGQQLPHLLQMAMNYIQGAANNGATMFVGLTTGAARLIKNFAKQELKDIYLPKMLSGEWQGTMALTEPQAGSSLSDIVSSASPTDQEGVYKIKGQKIFISAGDYEGAENVVHLMLARIDGAPAGTKGISLFIVPKYRIENGQLVDNDVVTAAIYHKMGQKCTPAVHFVAGDKDNCYGWLVGEPHQGLKYMFQMMNEARIGVGIMSAAIASMAYHASLKYAHERPQGRRLSEKDQKTTPQTLIINHPDVRRMLLFQKAVSEGALMLTAQAAFYADMLEVTEGEERERYQLLLDLLTPIVKTYPSEYGIQSVSAGLQVLGGYGYTTDFSLEQMYRDIRITTIYEGTTGIQSLDLLGRKIVAKNGKAAMLLTEEIGQTLQAALTFDDLKSYAELLQKEMGRLQQVMQKLMGYAMKGDVERYMADAVLFMEMSSLIVVAWMWLKMAVTAKQKLVAGGLDEESERFYESKLHTMRFFFHYELPKTKWLATRLMDDVFLTLPEEKEVIL
ncbi:butyryl-CoA dehydrogenase [Thermonema lapsum]|uniref:Butyryl-CoA dehydrogenase n=1 Tax=Thermonema lapsum TaxID=28195 RepID=A0A846MP05_9BACT|nr:acyl-CoA dehydrogenase [Thermonema lapsum]NIK73067.1 butyryl-CoA dehydrogenase [Thermonema lapsum]